MSEKKQSIGGLWKKSTKKGADFLKGNIVVNGEKIKIVVWANDKKTDDKFPDMRIFVDDWVPDTEQSKPQEKTFVDNQDDMPF